MFKATELIRGRAGFPHQRAVPNHLLERRVSFGRSLFLLLVKIQSKFPEKTQKDAEKV